jgi:hypothetical protein
LLNERGKYSIQMHGGKNMMGLQNRIGLSLQESMGILENAEVKLSAV